jgi:hypothetical protein
MPETVPVGREHELKTPYGSLYAQPQRHDSTFVHPARVETTDLDGNTSHSYEPSIEVDGRRYFVRTWFTYVDGEWLLGADRRPRGNPARRIEVTADSKWRNNWLVGDVIKRREERVAELLAEPLVVEFRKWAAANGDIFAAKNREQEIQSKESRLRNLQYELSQATRIVENLPDRHRELDEEAERARQKAARLAPEIDDLTSEIESLRSDDLPE